MKSLFTGSTAKIPTRSMWVVTILLVVTIAAGLNFDQLRPYIFVACLAILARKVSAKFGGLLSIALTSLNALFIIFSIQVLSYTVKIDMNAVVAACYWLLIVLTFIFHLLPAKTRNPPLDPKRAWTYAAIPALVVIVGLIGRISPLFPQHSWVMRGDAANNLIFAWTIHDVSGVDLGYFRENPVPVPASVINFFATLATPTTKTDYINSAISGLSLLWITLISLSSLLLGLAVRNVLKSSAINSVATESILILGATTIPLLWFSSGYALEAGFFGAQLEIFILIAMLCTLLATQGLASQLILLNSGLILTEMTWSPLAVTGGVLLGLFVLFNFRKIYTNWRLLSTQIVYAGVFVLFAVKTTIPSFTTQTEILADASGGVRTFDHNFVPLLVTILFGLCAVIFILGTKRFATVLAAATGSLLIGLLFLLFLRRGKDGWWAYYQLKYEWFVLVICCIMLVFAVVKILALARWENWRLPLAWSIVMGSVIAIIAILPSGMPWRAFLSNYVAQSLARDHPRAQADGIYQSFATYYSESHPSVLWNSGLDDEFYVDFWLLQMSSENIADPIRGLAYSRNLNDMAELCNVVKELGSNVTVVTKDAGLQGKFTGTCNYGGQISFISPLTG